MYYDADEERDIDRFLCAVAIVVLGMTFGLGFSIIIALLSAL